MSYYDDSSLFVAPNGYKTSVLFAQKPMDANGQLTFTRSNDTATRVGPDGLIEKVRTNLLLQSQTFDNASWSKVLASVTANVTTAPDGTLTADKLLAAVSISDQHRIDQTPTTAAGSNTFSVYAKKGEIEFIFLRIGSVGAYFNLNDGSVGSVSTGIVASSVDAGNGWYRCVITKTAAIANEVLRINLATAFGVNNFIGNGTDGAFIWGAQYELNDIATPYIATTTAAVSVGPVANVPRLDYLGGGCPKLLLEPQRTNLALFSEQLNNAYWTKNNTTITANTSATLDPTGASGADKIVETATTGFHGIERAFGTLSGSHCLSVLAKAAERNYVYLEFFTGATSFISFFDLSNGTIGTSAAGNNAKIENYGNGWYRLSISRAAGSGTSFFVTGLATADNTYSYAGNGTSGAYFYGCQIEVGSYATSYIPTLGASVTRGADAASKTGISSLIGQTEGTLYWEGEIKLGESSRLLFVSDGALLNFINTLVGSSGEVSAAIRVAATTSTAFTSSALTAGVHKIAFAYKANDSALYVDGVSISGTSGAAVPATSRLDIGSRLGADSFFNSGTSQALLFKTRLTNAQLAELTA